MIVLFDSECRLCARYLRFHLRHERDRSTRFFSIYAPEGIALAQSHGISGALFDGSFVVIKDGRALLRSDAMLALFRGLSAPFHHLSVLTHLPRGLRNGLFDLVFGNRARWFGRDDCLIPPMADRDRFVLAIRPQHVNRRLNKRV